MLQYSQHTWLHNLNKIPPSQTCDFLLYCLYLLISVPGSILDLRTQRAIARNWDHLLSHSWRGLDLDITTYSWACRRLKKYPTWYYYPRTRPFPFYQRFFPYWPSRAVGPRCWLVRRPLYYKTRCLAYSYPYGEWNLIIYSLPCLQYFSVWLSRYFMGKSVVKSIRDLPGIEISLTLGITEEGNQKLVSTPGSVFTHLIVQLLHAFSIHVQLVYTYATVGPTSD